ncbi:hypothetical protein L2E82_11080 [Cichorium intybus]|uniref:Uncharacterized protein n=1 Tax=Cichorium intybus TaxID=13427 RepID=A0ACB9GDC3_CICIN|nr:hypothetical protein L2E82_11080 [Cichorium intybus]
MVPSLEDTGREISCNKTSFIRLQFPPITLASPSRWPPSNKAPSSFCSHHRPLPVVLFPPPSNSAEAIASHNRRSPTHIIGLNKNLYSTLMLSILRRKSMGSNS